MSKPLVIGFPQSSYVWTTRAALAAKGIDYDFKPMMPPENRSPEHLALHPWGKVPVFQHDDLTLYETTAIASYVDNALDGPALMPDNHADIARARQWISVVDSYLYPPAVLRYALQYIYPRGPEGKPDREAIEGALPDIRMALETIDAGIGDSGWMVGDKPTLADYFLGPLVLLLGRFPEGGQLTEGLANIAKFSGQITQDKAFMSGAPQG